MKKIILVLMFLYSLIYAGTASNPTLIKNGKINNFSDDPSFNFYKIIVNKKGNIFISGSNDGSKYAYNCDINKVNLYDSDFNLIKSWENVEAGVTATLEPGTYIIQLADKHDGYFIVYSKVMNNFDNFKSKPTIKNGKNVYFGNRTAFNIYKFIMKNKGNIVVSGSNGKNCGYNCDINKVNLYDSDFNLIKSWKNVKAGVTATLEPGLYIIQLADDGDDGTFSVYSPYMATDEDNVTSIENTTTTDENIEQNSILSLKRGWNMVGALNDIDIEHNNTGIYSNLFNIPNIIVWKWGNSLKKWSLYTNLDVNVSKFPKIKFIKKGESFWIKIDKDINITPVSYTHLTLPTIA
jgi:hypothetical protein